MERTCGPAGAARAVRAARLLTLRLVFRGDAMAELVVAGKLATRQYQRAAKCAQFLEAERRVRRGTVLPLVPADYEAVVEKLGKEFDDKEAARHKVRAG